MPLLEESLELEREVSGPGGRAVAVRLMLLARVYRDTGMRWDQDAPLGGHVEAQYWLGWIHEMKLDPPDLRLARHGYEQAAKAGHLRAQHNFAIFLFYGRGGPLDHAEGLRWVRKAADGGLSVAGESVERLERQLGIRGG